MCYVDKIGDKQIYYVIVKATLNLEKNLPVSVSDFYMITRDKEIVDATTPPSNYKKLSCRGLFPETKTTGYIAFQSDKFASEVGLRK